MLKYLILLFLILSFMAALVTGITIAPDYLYRYTIEGNFPTQWYSISNFNPNLLKPTRYPFSFGDNYSAENLWREFHIKDAIVPMPYRHPQFKVVPIIKRTNNSESFEMGFEFLGAENRLVSEVHFLPNIVFSFRPKGQKIFDLPILKAVVANKQSSTIWSDLFSRKISYDKLDYDEMLYNLYLIDLRKRILPKNYISYGHVGEQEIGIVRLTPKNKDYNAELIMIMRQNIIYSYFLLTKVDDPEAQEVRDRFLKKVRFQAGSEAIGRIYYDEFKLLPIYRKIDQEGMIYLLAALSNWDKKKEILRELIFYLEKSGSRTQLKPLYHFANQVYGSTFSSLKEILSDDPELQLKSRIEQEDAQRIEDAKIEKLNDEIVVKKPLEDPDSLSEKLKQAKEMRRKRIKN